MNKPDLELLVRVLGCQIYDIDDQEVVLGYIQDGDSYVAIPVAITLVEEGEGKDKVSAVQVEPYEPLGVIAHTQEELDRVVERFRAAGSQRGFRVYDRCPNGFDVEQKLVYGATFYGIEQEEWIKNRQKLV